jgi:hypothetical protein
MSKDMVPLAESRVSSRAPVAASYYVLSAMHGGGCTYGAAAATATIYRYRCRCGRFLPSLMLLPALMNAVVIAVVAAMLWLLLCCHAEIGRSPQQVPHSRGHRTPSPG